MDIDEFRKACTRTQTVHHVVPAYLNIHPIGYLLYEEDRTQPLPNVLTDTYQRVDRPMPVHGGNTHKKQQQPAASARYPTAAPVIALPWERARVDQQVQRDAAATEYKQYRLNPVTGKRERVEPPSAEEIQDRAQQLKAGGVRPGSMPNVLALLGKVADRCRQEAAPPHQLSPSKPATTAKQPQVPSSPKRKKPRKEAPAPPQPPQPSLPLPHVLPPPVSPPVQAQAHKQKKPQPKRFLRKNMDSATTSVAPLTAYFRPASK